MMPLLSDNVVAVCDVDFGLVERALAGRLRPNREGVVSPDAIKLRDAYLKGKQYTDFREMLDKQRDIEAVVIATPDDTHAVIAIAATKRPGKHVYVQSRSSIPCTSRESWTGSHAQSPKLVTEMGNQGHSREGTRRIRELIGAGVIGTVREVHVWTDRPVRYWARGNPAPRVHSADTSRTLHSEQRTAGALEGFGAAARHGSAAMESPRCGKCCTQSDGRGAADSATGARLEALAWPGPQRPITVVPSIHLARGGWDLASARLATWVRTSSTNPIGHSTSAFL